MRDPGDAAAVFQSAMSEAAASWRSWRRTPEPEEVVVAPFRFDPGPDGPVLGRFLADMTIRAGTTTVAASSKGYGTLQWLRQLAGAVTAGPVTISTSQLDGNQQRAVRGILAAASGRIASDPGHQAQGPLRRLQSAWEGHTGWKPQPHNRGSW